MVALPETPTPTRDAIFDAYEADADTGFRPHLGASQIGKSCERALWYDFRWATPAHFPGRILRLFETGQLEEARLVKNLRRIGATGTKGRRKPGRPSRDARRSAGAALQRAMRIGRGGLSSIDLVTPPKMRSRSREWP